MRTLKLPSLADDLEEFERIRFHMIIENLTPPPAEQQQGIRLKDEQEEARIRQLKLRQAYKRRNALHVKKS